MLKLLVTTAWNNCIRFDIQDGKYQYPTIKDVFNKAYNSISHKFLIAKKTSLFDLMYKKGKIGRVYHLENDFKNISLPFTLFKLDELIEINKQKYKVLVGNPITEEKFEFSATSSLVEYAQRNIINITGPYIIGGFVKSRGFNELPEMISMNIMAINNFGKFL